MNETPSRLEIDCASTDRDSVSLLSALPAIALIIGYKENYTSRVTLPLSLHYVADSLVITQLGSLQSPSPRWLAVVRTCHPTTSCVSLGNGRPFTPPNGLAHKWLGDPELVESPLLIQEAGL